MIQSEQLILPCRPIRRCLTPASSNPPTRSTPHVRTTFSPNSGATSGAAPSKITRKFRRNFSFQHSLFLQAAEQKAGFPARRLGDRGRFDFTPQDYQASAVRLEEGQVRTDISSTDDWVALLLSTLGLRSGGKIKWASQAHFSKCTYPRKAWVSPGHRPKPVCRIEILRLPSLLFSRRAEPVRVALVPDFEVEAGTPAPAGWRGCPTRPPAA